MSVRTAGGLLIIAATLFWLSWLLMPGVGVTNAATILDLVAGRRSLVLLSVMSQLLSAALYVPSLLGISCWSPSGSYRAVRWGAGLLLLGAMGSAVDAIFHLLAYAMTQPGLDRSTLVAVMAFMQGPGLRLVAPLILCFFVGTAMLSFALAKNGLTSRASLFLNLAALGVAISGGFLTRHTVLSSRAVGLSVLGFFSLAQMALGFDMSRPRRNTVFVAGMS